MLNDILLFVAIGFAAQMVDGALGMAYGLTATSVLLSFGTAPAVASASVHAAEVFTIRKHIFLRGQKCAAGIDQINTRQAILRRDFLCA